MTEELLNRRARVSIACMCAYEALQFCHGMHYSCSAAILSAESWINRPTDENFSRAQLAFDSVRTAALVGVDPRSPGLAAPSYEVLAAFAVYEAWSSGDVEKVTGFVGKAASEYAKSQCVKRESNLKEVKENLRAKDAALLLGGPARHDEAVASVPREA